MVFLAILGTYFVATTIATEKGPFGIFEWVRGLAGLSLASDHWFRAGINCPKCLSFWVALVFTAVLKSIDPMTPGTAFLVWFGITGGAWVLHYVTLLIRLTIAKA